jgi:hypothetical protein
MSIDTIAQAMLATVVRNVPAALNLARSEESLEVFKDVVCYNQSKIADFHFVSGRKHKILKEKLEITRSNPNDLNIIDLRKASDELEGYLDSEFRRICRINFDFCQKLFEGRVSKSKKKPRFCVKVVRNNSIVNLARTEEARSINDDEYPVNANTAFSSIIESGKPYLCNNIPLQYRQNKYLNARIDREEFPDYSINWIRELSCVSRPDKDWQRCWNKVCPEGYSHMQKSPIETCYKSTLVTPLALNRRNDWLSEEFCRRFEIQDLKCFGFFVWIIKIQTFLIPAKILLWAISLPI